MKKNVYKINSIYETLNLHTSSKKRYYFILYTIYILFLIIIFGLVYMYLHNNKIDFKYDDFDSMYFSCINMFTVGFGEYVPKSKIGRFIVCFQIILFWSSSLYFTISVVE